jgi:hypothetical protein
MDRNTAHYLFGANDPNYRESGAATLCMYQSILRLRDQCGVGEIDFVGINSPLRGAFKLSFGGVVVSYTTVQKMNP